MGTDRRSDLRIEAIGVSAVEQQAITEGLSVARPLWDAHGIDLIVYDVADGLAEVRAAGVQVKAFSGMSMSVFTSYPDALVMAYLVAAGTADACLFALTAAQARRMAVEYTTAHERKPGARYDPERDPGYRWDRIPKALWNGQLAEFRVGGDGAMSLRKACRLPPLC